MQCNRYVELKKIDVVLIDFLPTLDKDDAFYNPRKYVEYLIDFNRSIDIPIILTKNVLRDEINARFVTNFETKKKIDQQKTELKDLSNNVNHSLNPIWYRVKKDSILKIPLPTIWPFYIIQYTALGCPKISQGPGRNSFQPP